MKTAVSCEEISCHREEWNEMRPSKIWEVTAAFRFGELCGVCGPDGSGKGLLLNLLGLLEPPDTGTIRLFDELDASTLSPDERREVRNENFGFVFNHPGLLPSFSVSENVAMPLFRICGVDAREARRRTSEALDFCGIGSEEGTLGGRLGPEERALAAFARAIAHGPRILVLISPRMSGPLLPLGRRAASELGLCVLWAGTEAELLPFAHRMLHLHEGRILSECRP